MKVSPLPRPRAVPALLAASLLLACEGTPTSPEVGALAFSTGIVELREGEVVTVEVRNRGDRDVGPVELLTGTLRDAGGAAVPGARVRARPGEVPTLPAGRSAAVELSLVLPTTGVQPGAYAGELTARAGPGRATLEVEVRVLGLASAATEVEVAPVEGPVRRGDVLRLGVEVRDSLGGVLEGAPVAWTVAPADGGFVDGGHSFVGYREGPVRLVAAVGTARDTLELELRPRDRRATLTPLGAGEERLRYTSDLWVGDGHAWLGTWGARAGGGSGVAFGNTLVTWDVSTPADPRRVGATVVDARTVNDVKIHPDRPLALLTHEGSNDALNGVTLLDISDPAAPRPLSRTTRGLEPGVHNAWLEGDHAFLVVDGVGNGLLVLDVSDPTAPREAARWYAGSSFLHDVYVRDGLAFLSHWDAGLVILDVGHGIVGGSPGDPREVARLAELGGETHNAWYWPERALVFVGEEDFRTPGQLRVVDVSELRSPRVVATFAVPGDTPHNLWVDEEGEVLWLAWYGAGIRAVDVSGELLGDLSRQGREMVGLRYAGEGPCPGEDATCTWAPQLHGGLLYLADMNRGLVVMRPEVDPVEAPR